jgi:hypothetical protein
MSTLEHSRSGDFEREGYKQLGRGTNIAWYNANRQHLHIPAGSAFDGRRLGRTHQLTTDAQIRPVRPGENRILPTVKEILLQASRPNAAKFAPPDTFPLYQTRKASQNGKQTQFLRSYPNSEALNFKPPT